MNLLYITRKFPPMVGGMENMSAALAKEFARNVQTTTISWGKSQKYLPYFILLALAQACFYIPTKKITHIHIGDALLSPLGLVLKILFRKKTTINIAGLDIIFTFPGYQSFIPKFVAQFDSIICISNATRDECLKRGIPANKCVVIPCGIYPEKETRNISKNELAGIVKQNVANKTVLVTVGRLVKRKGVVWFVKNIFPYLKKDRLYLIVGDGPDRGILKILIKRLRLEKRVFLLGKISDEMLNIIYHTSDVFVMPNIPTPGTMEGFGIVAIEASSRGLPIIASDCEGIRDAVIPDKTGALVMPMDTHTYVNMLNNLPNLDKQAISRVTNQKYSWENIGRTYIHHFQKL